MDNKSRSKRSKLEFKVVVELVGTHEQQEQAKKDTMSYVLSCIIERMNRDKMNC